MGFGLLPKIYSHGGWMCHCFFSLLKNWLCSAKSVYGTRRRRRFLSGSTFSSSGMSSLRSCRFCFWFARLLIVGIWFFLIVNIEVCSLCIGDSTNWKQLLYLAEQ